MITSPFPESVFPDLRFVPTGSLVPHEQHDDQRLEPLVRLIREQCVLKNPPVVTPLSEEREGEARYVVLDGANRAAAAGAAGFPHVVVQVVPYSEPSVTLTTWNHALSKYPHDEIEEVVRQVEGLRCCGADAMHARAALARRQAVALIQYDDAIMIALMGGQDLHSRNAQLNDLVGRYSDRGKFHRVAVESLEDARDRHPDTTALVVFPHYEPAEILELAALGDRLPAGITRHLVRWRALRVNVPTEPMADPHRSLDEKNRWLRDWLRAKTSSRQVRFYEEPTVLFDE